MQMLAISEREYKIIMITMTPDTVGKVDIMHERKVDNMHEKMEHFSKEVETTRKAERKC